MWRPLNALARAKDVTDNASCSPFGDQSKLSTSPHHVTRPGHGTTGDRSPPSPIVDRPYHPAGPSPLKSASKAVSRSGPLFIVDAALPASIRTGGVSAAGWFSAAVGASVLPPPCPKPKYAPVPATAASRTQALYSILRRRA